MNERRRVLLALAVPISILLACDAGLGLRVAEQRLAEATMTAAGTDVAALATAGTDVFRPTATRDFSIGCVAAPEGYAWTYENFRQSSGAGGVACNCRLVFRNNWSEPVYLIAHTAYDNNKMSGQAWQRYRLEPGGQHDEQVNRTEYTDGVVTYSKVDKVLAIRDTPDCADYVADGADDFWEMQARPVDEMPCP